MLTALSIKRTGQETATVLHATQLLAMLQQALPGFEKPDGEGILATPWVPKKPSQWWYCAKEKPKFKDVRSYNTTTKTTTTVVQRQPSQRFTTDGTGVAWIKVGGKYISIKTDSLYASQHNPPKTGSTGAPPAVHEDLAYSDLFASMAQEGGGSVKDATTAIQMRKMLKGEAGGAAVLPLLTSVLFLSEVARNHTAFHTNLMMLDLVEKGVALTGGTSFKYTFRNVLWQPQIIDSVMKLNSLTQEKQSLVNQKASLDRLFDLKREGYRLTNPEFNRFRNASNENYWIKEDLKKVKTQTGQAKGAIGNAKVGMDELNSPKLSTSGGESSLPGGIASMSHKGSAYGSAYDMEGKGNYRGVSGTGHFTPPPSPLTIVRRKEATLLIRWLERALNAAGGYEALALSESRTMTTAGLYDGIGNSFGTSDSSYLKILELMQKRVDSFDLML